MSSFVEVRDEEQRCFLKGRLLDIKGEQYLVQLGGADNASTQRWVPWTLVREEPAEQELQQPVQVNDLLEVKCFPDGDAEPPTWFEAEVKLIKGEFYKVHFVGAVGGDEVVEMDRMRPLSSSEPRTKPNIVKRIFPVADPHVLSWFMENESRVVQDVCTKSHLLALRIDQRSSQIRMFGTEKCITCAKMLLELHGRHVSDMHRMHMEREQLASKLQAEKEKLSTGVHLEFPIERELIGLVVGKGGRNIAEAKKASGVDHVTVDPSGPRVIVVGPTQESVEMARELLQFVTELVPVKPEQVGWLIGRGGRNFKELQEKTKITRLNVDKASHQVVLVGTRTAVEAAKLYMETHLRFLSEFESEQKESDRLRQELRGMSISDDFGDYPPPSRADRAGGRGRGSADGARGRGYSTGGSLVAAGRGGTGANGRLNASRDVSSAPPVPAADAVDDAGGGEGFEGARGRGGGRGRRPVSARGSGRGGSRPSEDSRNHADGEDTASPVQKDNPPVRSGRGAGRGGGGRSGGVSLSARPVHQPAADAEAVPNGDAGEGNPQRPAPARRAAGRGRSVPRKESTANTESDS